MKEEEGDQQEDSDGDGCCRFYCLLLEDFETA